MSVTPFIFHYSRHFTFILRQFTYVIMHIIIQALHIERGQNSPQKKNWFQEVGRKGHFVKADHLTLSIFYKTISYNYTQLIFEKRLQLFRYREPHTVFYTYTGQCLKRAKCIKHSNVHVYMHNQHLKWHLFSEIFVYSIRKKNKFLIQLIILKLNR